MKTITREFLEKIFDNYFICFLDEKELLLNDIRSLEKNDLVIVAPIYKRMVSGRVVLAQVYRVVDEELPLFDFDSSNSQLVEEEFRDKHYDGWKRKSRRALQKSIRTM